MTYVANVQKQFTDFHEQIKLKRYDENATLCEKRDRVLKRLKDNLEKLFSDKGLTAPTFTPFNQGSYAMGTGIKPLNGDYDIDVGLRFDISKDDYEDPVEVKQWVLDALEGHTQRVEMRRPCVTVFYSQDGEPIYHVDLAIYSDEPDGKMYIAKGKPSSSEEYRVWEVSDPQGLIDLVGNRFDDANDAKQFRRIIRYLKRWRQEKFASSGHAAPTGIALTVAAYHWFIPNYTVTYFSNAKSYNDLEALRVFVSTLLNQFSTVWHDEEWAERLVIKLPVDPGSDLLDKMTNLQMADFKTKLSQLLAALDEAKDEVDPVAACETLQKQFGTEFPVPPKDTTAKKSGLAVVSSSASA